MTLLAQSFDITSLIKTATHTIHHIDLWVWYKYWISGTVHSYVIVISMDAIGLVLVCRVQGSHIAVFCGTNRLLSYPSRLLPWPWWRHQMKQFSALLALCVGNSPVTGEFPSQRPVTRSCDTFFHLRLNKRLSKQSWPRCLRRYRAHYDATVMAQKQSY